MKRFVGTAAIALVLAIWGGVEVAKAAVELSCNTTNCTFNEEIGPVQEKYYHGHCDGSGMTQDNSSMTCDNNSEKNLTCVKHASWNVWNDTGYWSCTCTNHGTAEDKHPTIYLTCPP